MANEQKESYNDPQDPALCPGQEVSENRGSQNEHVPSCAHKNVREQLNRVSPQNNFCSVRKHLLDTCIVEGWLVFGWLYKSLAFVFGHFCPDKYSSISAV